LHNTSSADWQRMDERLAKLIRNYQDRVAQAVAMLEGAGIPRPSSNTAWATSDFPQRGRMPGGFAFYPHGFGCAVHFQDWIVDFDFGAAGETDGFDAGRLCSFARDRLAEYGFDSEKDIRSSFHRAVESDELKFSGALYYLGKGDVHL
jgi:hypothetical protein